MGRNVRPNGDRERVEVQVAYLRRIGRHALADTLERLLDGVVEPPAQREDEIRAHERQLLADLLDRNASVIARYVVSAERAVGFVSLLLRMGAAEVPVHSWGGSLIDDTRPDGPVWRVKCCCGWSLVGPQREAVDRAKAHVASEQERLEPERRPA